MRMTFSRRFLPLLVLSTLAVSCAGAPTGIASNPLVSQLTSGLGVTADQAVGGTGAMLGLAQNKLTPDQFSQVTNAIPGASDITKAAAPLIGSSPISSLGDVQGIFTKLGMSPDTVSKFAPILTQAASSVGGPQVASLLGGIFPK
jgi:Protein of unknown function VcgC/VcgE (DUF2780)